VGTAEAEEVQVFADDVFGVAARLGFICPPLALTAAVAKTLVDAGFGIYFRRLATHLQEQRAAQTAGAAAAAGAAATTQHQRDERSKSMGRALGYRRTPPGVAVDRDAARHLGAGPVPQASNLRSLVRIYDQGAKGSCTANGIGGAVRGCQISKGASPDIPILSRLALYWLERAYLHETDQDAGAFIHLGFQALNTFGFAPETAWEYSDDDERFKVKPPLEVLEAAFDQRTPVDYQRILSTGGARVDDVKRALGAGHLVVFGTDVTEDFCKGNLGPTGVLQVPGSGDLIAGGHCMLWCGHDATVDVANSWGPDFADRGFFRMSWDYVEWSETDDLWIVKDAPLYSAGSL
jgi:hypothetical protein